MINSEFFYKNDIEWNSYITIPKAFIINEEYKNISAETKLMYGLLIDRMKISIENKWIDEKGRCYLIYTVEEICTIFNLSNKTAIKVLKELEKLELLEKKRQGLRKPNLLYVKKINFGEAVSSYKKNKDGGKL